MRVYYSQGSGCLVLTAVFLIMGLFLMGLGRFLFTTPLGLAILLVLVIKYFIDQRSRPKRHYGQGGSGAAFDQAYSENGQTGQHEQQFEGNEDNNGSGFDRSDYADVEDVEYFDKED